MSMPFDLAGIHPFGDKQACQAVKNDKARTRRRRDGGDIVGGGQYHDASVVLSIMTSFLADVRLERWTT